MDNLDLKAMREAATKAGDDDVIALLDRVERAEADAERYKWLREDPPVELSVRRFPGDTERGCYLDGIDLDRAIDKARAAQEGK